MDPITHIVLTRTLVSANRAVLLAGIGPDAPFYLTYPAWAIVRGDLPKAIATASWPDPPRWIATLHHVFHSVPMVLLGVAIYRVVTRRWPTRVLSAWLLHITIDLPTHSREPWGPRFLWPISNFAFDGWSWAEALTRFMARQRP